MKYYTLHALLLGTVAMLSTACNTENLEAEVASGELLSAGASIDVSGDASRDNTIQITANCDWTVSSDASWITITKPSDKKGHGSQDLVFDIEASTLPTTQTATLTLTSNGGLYHTIAVHQRAGQISREVLPVSFYFTYEGGEQTLEITSNSVWEAKVSVTGNWLHIDGGESVSGEGNRTLTVRADPNSNPDGLEAHIIVTDIDNKVSANDILVNIGGKAPSLDIAPANDVAATGGQATFTVKSNFSWQAQIEQVEPVATEQWALFGNGEQLCRGGASNDGEAVTLQLAPNPTLGERRVTVSVRTQVDMGESIEKTLTIRQEAATMPLCYTPRAVSVGMTEAQLTFAVGSATLPVTECGILYSTDADRVLQGTRIDATLAGSDATVALDNLQPGTTYHVRAYATSAVGTAYSDPFSFTTRLTPGRDANPTPGT